MWTFTGALDWGYLSPEKETPTAHEFWCRVRLAMKCRWFCWWNIWIESSFAPGVLVTGNPGNTGAKHLHPPAVPLFGVSKFCCSLQQEVGFLIPTDYMALFEVMCYFPNGKYTGNMESMGIHSFFEGDLKQNPRFLQYMMLLFFAPKKPQNQRWSTTNHRSYRLAYFTSVPGVILMCPWGPLSLIKCVASPDELPSGKHTKTMENHHFW